MLLCCLYRPLNRPPSTTEEEEEEEEEEERNADTALNGMHVYVSAEFTAKRLFTVFVLETIKQYFLSLPSHLADQGCNAFKLKHRRGVIFVCLINFVELFLFVFGV